jgi:hypothetical protein
MADCPVGRIRSAPLPARGIFGHSANTACSAAML